MEDNANVFEADHHCQGLAVEAQLQSCRQHCLLCLLLRARCAEKHQIVLTWLYSW